MKKTHRRTFWLIVNPRSSEEALPVFGFEEEARMFLGLGTSDRWQVRKTTEAELASVLVGSCAGVGRMVLNPLPGPFGETARASLHGVVLEKRWDIIDIRRSRASARRYGRPEGAFEKG